jgi:hypothetical protein
LDIILNSKSRKEIETAVILIGSQGTGQIKFDIDAISQLFGRYAITYENIID